MFESHKWLWDLVAGSGLALALLLVFLIDRPTSDVVVPNTLEVRVVSGGGSKPQSKLRLAVTGPEFAKVQGIEKSVLWDDMGQLLKQLGDGYAYDEIRTMDIASNPKMLDNYDVLFLTCAPGNVEISEALTRYVARGGTLYASDFRFKEVAAAFPEFVNKNLIGRGTKQNLNAQVVDPSLKEALGTDSIHLRFDLGAWRVAAFSGPRVTTLLYGTYRKERFINDRIGAPADAPLAVKFDVGKGTVIFTSFHNEKQNSELETKLLQYLVFRLVTAEVEANVMANLRESGFTPQNSNLLSTPKGNPSITKKYQHKSGKPLQFALGFRPEGAEMRLTITSPDGKNYTWEGSSTVILEVPNSPKGEWTYTVTALHLPYPNYPFTVTVGEKSGQ